MTATQPGLFELPAFAVAGKPGRRRSPVASRQPVTTPNPRVVTGNRAWTITFPAPARMLSMNTVKHWRTTSPVKKAWREAMYQYAKAAKLPTGLGRVRIEIELRFPTGGRRDAPNYHAYLAKPCVDAIGPGRSYVIRKGKLAGTQVVEKGYGLIPDDTAEHLDGPHLTIGRPTGRAGGYGEVTVTITDLSGGDHA